VFYLKKQVTTITQTVTIPASPEEVYDAYTNPALHAEFTDSKATGNPKVGGKFTAWDGYIFGKYLELEQGKRVVQQWETTDWEEGYGPSKVELTFKAAGKGTELTMVHFDVPVEQKDELAGGWEEFYWKPLKEYFENKQKGK
jgi:uncharacterized protein YndB with AHSA1/START domain